MNKPLTLCAVPVLLLHSLSYATSLPETAGPTPEDSSLAPRLDLSGVGFGTLQYGNPYLNAPAWGAPKGAAAVDFSDSDLNLEASQLLSSQMQGSLTLGLMAPDVAVPGTGSSVFINNALLTLQTERTEWAVGRADNPAAHVVDFPVLREEDLITFTHPLDPFSNGQSSVEHRFSNSAAFTWNQRMTWFENLHVQHLIDSRGQSSTPVSVNSAGLTVGYLAEPAREASVRFPSYGVGYEHEFGSQAGTGDLDQLTVGGVLNLSGNPAHRLDLRAQELVCFGSPVAQFQSLGDTFQAAYQAAAIALRYLREDPESEGGRPSYQLAVTAGYRSFFDVGQASSAGLAVTALKHLGRGFDVVGQFSTEWRDVSLAAQYQGQQSENVVELGFVFDFRATVLPGGPGLASLSPPPQAGSPPL